MPLHRPIQDRTGNRLQLTVAIATSLLMFILYLLGGAHRPLSLTPEIRVAVTARNMIETDNWLVPRYAGEERLEKPPLPYWMTAIAAKLLGPDRHGNLVSELAACLPSAVCATLTIFACISFVSMYYGIVIGVFTGCVIGLSAFFVLFAQAATGEMLLTFFTTCALLFAARLSNMRQTNWMDTIFFGIALGLAMLTKGHLPLIFVLLPTLWSACFQRRFTLRKVQQFSLGLLLAFAIVVPILWQMNQATEGRMFETAFHETGLSGARGGHDQSDRWIYYFYKFPHMLLPWTPFIILFGLLQMYKRNSAFEKDTSQDNLELQAQLKFFAAAVILGFAVLYGYWKQQYYYLLPLLPVSAIIAASWLHNLKSPGGMREERLAWGLLAIGAIAALGIALLPRFAEIKYFWSISAAILILPIFFYLARKSVEAAQLHFILCLGSLVYSGYFLWTILYIMPQRYENPLVRMQDSLRATLSLFPQDTFLYTEGAGGAHQVRYYLGREYVAGLRQLEKEGPDKTNPPRLVLCSAEIARTLGSNNDAELQLLPVDASFDWSAFTAYQKIKKSNPENRNRFME